MADPDPRIRYLEEVRPGQIPTGPQPVNRRHTKSEQAIDQARTDQIVDNLVVAESFQHAGTLVAFNGAVAVVQGGPFVQNYTNADQTLNAYTPDDESGAYSGIATGVGGTPYASLVDLNALRTAVENGRAALEDLLAFTNALVNFLQSRGDIS